MIKDYEVIMKCETCGKSSLCSFNDIWRKFTCDNCYNIEADKLDKYYAELDKGYYNYNRV